MTIEETPVNQSFVCLSLPNDNTSTKIDESNTDSYKEVIPACVVILCCLFFVCIIAVSFVIVYDDCIYGKEQTECKIIKYNEFGNCIVKIDNVTCMLNDCLAFSKYKPHTCVHSTNNPCGCLSIIN